MSAVEKKQNGITRRNFLKGAAVGGAAGLVAGGGGTALFVSGKDQEQKSWLPEKWDYEADVVVVGFGGAGGTAAIVAHDAGAQVLILEKMPEGKEGGNTKVSGNVWVNPTNISQAVELITNLCGEFPIPQDMIQTWAETTSKNSEWVESLGAELGRMPLPDEFSDLSGSECYDGYHHVMPGWGMGRLFELLKTSVEDRKIEVLYETPGTELIQDPDTKEILGVVAERQGKVYIKANKAVILTSGGFQNNQEMIRDYLRLPKGYPWGTPAATGDGIKMAQQVGADLWHMDNFMGAMGIKAPEYESGFYVTLSADSWINVALDGKRFVNEKVAFKHGHAKIHGRYELYPATPMYTIFDETTRLAGPLNLPIEYYPFGWNKIIEGYQWSLDNSAEIEKGWIVKADTVRELATKIGLDADALEETIRKYNSCCKTGEDPEFGRESETLVPLETPPYYAFEWGPVFCYTCGGPRRNKDCQVLTPEGKVIPRLYCAGEISSTYSYCMGGGYMIGDTLAFGRVAGKNAAAQESWT